MARRCFFAHGGRRGCAPGAPARPAAVPAYRRRRAFPPAAFCLLSRHIAPPLFSPRPAPRLRLRALCRPCGRPKPPFPGALAAAVSVRGFLPLSSPVAPPLRYRASCRASKVTVISHILPLFFVKCLRRTFFSLRYHIIFTIICYNNQNRITVMAHSRREEGHCRKKRRNRHGKNTHCGR